MKKKIFMTMLSTLLIASFALSGCENSDSDGDSAATDDIVSFEEITVVDNDECSIVLAGMDEDQIIDVELENKSEEKTYVFLVESASVNGVIVDPLFGEALEAGKKLITEIDFSYDTTLEENGITTFTDIELTFVVYDEDDPEAENIVEETVHFYPFGEENAIAFERETLKTDTVIVDNDQVTAIVIGYSEDDTWGYEVDLFLVNKTDIDAIVDIDEVSINDYMLDPLWVDTVPAGKCVFSAIYWDDSELEEIGVTDYSQIEEIEFLFTAYSTESEGEELNYLAEETITLNP